MEDWEHFFVEKSHRRFDKERVEQRTQRTKTALAAVVLVLIVLGGVVALAMLP